jgi:hypothetical protein
LQKSRSFAPEKRNKSAVAIARNREFVTVGWFNKLWRIMYVTEIVRE